MLVPCAAGLMPLVPSIWKLPLKVKVSSPIPPRRLFMPMKLVVFRVPPLSAVIVQVLFVCVLCKELNSVLRPTRVCIFEKFVVFPSNAVVTVPVLSPVTVHRLWSVLLGPLI